MKLIYLTVDGRAKIETCHLGGEVMFETADGYHPVTNDSIWQDAKRIKDPIMVIVQGVRGPYGATMEEGDVSRVLFDMELRERSFKPQSVSRMWWRSLVRLSEWFMKYIVLIVMGIIIAWAMYDSFAPKGGY